MNLTAIQQAIEDSVNAGVFNSIDEAVAYVSRHFREMSSNPSDSGYEKWKRKELEKADHQIENGDVFSHEEILQDIQEMTHSHNS